MPAPDVAPMVARPLPVGEHAVASDRSSVPAEDAYPARADARSVVVDAGDVSRLVFPDLVRVPAGEVTISDRRSKRSWQADVNSIEIGVHQLAQAEYAAVTGEHPSTQQGEGLPVTEVTWWEAVLFCNKLSEIAGLPVAYSVLDDDVIWDRTSLGYRLLTEAEWEHACRAGTAGPHYAELDPAAWYRKNSDEQLHEVKTKAPNAWRIHDTLGNVWEWCWDFIDPDTYRTYRVLRGGGWFDEHWSCSASTRRGSHPTLKIDDVGFRVARGQARTIGR